MTPGDILTPGARRIARLPRPDERELHLDLGRPLADSHVTVADDPARRAELVALLDEILRRWQERGGQR